ncbi:MAG: amidohydrolase family protein [Spirochaetales bacterium]|nr:amidohydrolase family protein [Spirochaetales bacterium]
MKSSIYGETIYTGNEVIKDSYINFNGNLITGITKDPEGVVLEKAPVITPAFIDPHCHIGMIRSGEPGNEAEANDHIDPIIPNGDALDSVQMDDAAFKASIECGTLYSCALPGSGNIIGGHSAVLRNYGTTTTKALIRRAGIKAAFGYNPMSVREWKGSRPYTRMGALSLLKRRFDDVKIQAGKGEPLTGDDQVILDILEKRQTLRVHVHKTDDIASLLRLVDAYDLKITVEHTCDVFSDEIYRELAERGIAVIYGPMDSLAYKVELKHDDWRNIKPLVESGVKFGLMTDHPVVLQKTLYIQLRWFLRIGFSKEQALEIITRSNAEIIGLDDILGTLEKGKWASFVLWNGDPFDLGNFPLSCYGEGELVYKEK